MMQAQIPAGLQALVQASQVLQQESSPVVQTPMGPKPTVAGMVSQGLNQLAAQKAQPFTQMPSVQQTGQQAGIGAQIQAQQAAQQRQMAQDPQAIAAMAAKMIQPQQAAQPAEQGIANLPVNMQFKDGGIIGFDGTNESSVPEPEEKPKRSLFKTYEDWWNANRAEDARKAAVEAANAAKRNAQLEQQSQGSFFNYLFGTPSMVATPRPQMTAATDPRSLGVAMGESATGREKIRGMMEEERARNMAQIRGETVPAPAPAPAPARPAMARPPAAPQGIAAALPASIPAPTIADIKAGAEQMVPAGPTEEFIKERRRVAAEREARLKGMPDLEAEGIAAIQQAGQEREALRKQKQERDLYNSTRAFFRDLQTRGASYDTVQEGIFAREEANRIAKLNEQESILKLKQAQQARAMGDLDRADALIKEVYDAQQKLQTARTTAAEIGARLSGTVYSSQMTYLSQRMNDASQERIKSQELAMRAKELQTNKDGQQLMSSQARVNEAIKTWEAVNDKHKMAASMTPEMMKNPEMKALYDKFVEEKQKVWDTTVQPAINNRDRLEQKVFGTTMAPAPAKKSAPQAGDVVDGWRFKGGNPADKGNWEKA